MSKPGTSLFGNVQNGQEFEIVQLCCNSDIDFEGRTYKRLAESGAENNVMETETCRMYHLCHAVVVKVLQESSHDTPS